VFLLPALCFGGCVVAAKRSSAACYHAVEVARVTLRTDRKPIQAELAPLGEVSEVHWVLDPNRHCDVMPVPGSEPDTQYGVVRIGPAAARDLVSRNANWEKVDGLEVERLLLPYVPGGAAWLHSWSLDERFVGGRSGENAQYYVDTADGLVLFYSDADHFR
jgi:hypothetical protein